MVKFAKSEEKPFDPISNKVLQSISNPAQQADPQEAEVHLELAPESYPPCPAQARGTHARAEVTAREETARATQASSAEGADAQRAHQAEQAA